MNSDDHAASRYRLLRIIFHCTVITSQKTFMKSGTFICLECSQCAWQITLKASFELCSLIINLWIPCPLLASNCTKLWWRSTDSANNQENFEFYFDKCYFCNISLMLTLSKTTVGPVTVIKICLKNILWLSCIFHRLGWIFSLPGLFFALA